MNIRQTLSARIEAAFASLGYEAQALVKSSTRPEFGDYQANGVMSAAKRAGENPRELATRLVQVLELDDVASHIEIAGPGFLNITLKPEYLAQVAAAMVAQSEPSITVVVDYSAPNLAKEMHIGHLRSSVIGDCIVRVLEAQGHNVIRQNHVGDWGTQFGMLLTYLSDSGKDSDQLSDLEDFYRAAKQKFDADEDFRRRSRQAVVELQAGDEHALQVWRKFIDISLAHCVANYQRLGLTLGLEHTMGESAYNDDLAGVVRQLDEKGLLRESDGAQCVFLEEFKSKKGDILPVIVQKSDGGYLYATSDLAAVIHRTGRLKATRVLYFTDARQSLHFKQIFAVANRAGFNKGPASLEHMPFGTILGADGKPFKTRTGGVVKLAEVLDEAEARATALVKEKNPSLGDEQASELGHIIGIGAVKYGELSKNRTSDYAFDWAQIISFEGNTSPYLQYAYTRIQSIFTRGEVDAATLPAQTIAVDEPERRLAVTIAGFNDILKLVADEGMPHYLCGYLYELATRFTQFYEACPILSSEEKVRQRRLVLANQSANTLKQGLEFLGISVPARM